MELLLLLLLSDFRSTRPPEQGAWAPAPQPPANDDSEPVLAAEARQGPAQAPPSA